MPALEEIIADIADNERKRAPAFTFIPVYAFVQNAVQIAKGQERQSIMDALPKRGEGKSAEWNAGFDAAVTAFLRMLVTRSM
jgi:hypothetical protein